MGSNCRFKINIFQNTFWTVWRHQKFYLTVVRRRILTLYYLPAHKPKTNRFISHPSRNKFIMLRHRVEAIQRHPVVRPSSVIPRVLSLYLIKITAKEEQCACVCVCVYTYTPLVGSAERGCNWIYGAISTPTGNLYVQ